MLAELPLPWTLQSLWTLAQLAAQISFVAVFVGAILFGLARLAEALNRR